MRNWFNVIGRVGALRCAAPLAALVLAACSEAPTGPPESGPGPGTPDAGSCLPLGPQGAGDGGPAWAGVQAGDGGLSFADFTAYYDDAFCDGLRRCFGADPLLAQQCRIQLKGGVFGVITGFGSGLGFHPPDHPGFAAAIDAGAVTYDPQAAAACLQAPWTLCDRYLPTGPEACFRVFTPTVAAGGTCRSALDCVSGACDFDGGACPGTCHAGSGGHFHACGWDGDAACGGHPEQCNGARCGFPSGGSCPFEGYCAPSLFCSRPGSGADGTCTPRADLGNPCGFEQDHLADFDSPSRLCQPGLACRGRALLVDGGVRPGSCAPLLQLGDACPSLRADEVANVSSCRLGLECSCGRCVPAQAGYCAKFPGACQASPPPESCYGK